MVTQLSDMKFALLITSLLLSSLAMGSPKDDPYELPTVVAVEHKKFEPRHDITAWAGIMPLDAFYKALEGGASYTYGWKGYLRWEVLNGQLTTTQDTGLKKDLIDDFDVQPTGILDSVKYHLTTNLVYTPIYSKNLFFNQKIFRGELSFVGGGGLVGFNSGDTAPMIGGGVVLRYFWSEQTSFKFDSRLYYHTAQYKSSSVLLMINFGYSIDLGAQ
jgi:outer membrane beta-barrel protein